MSAGEVFQLALVALCVYHPVYQQNNDAAEGKAADIVSALTTYREDQVAFYGNYAEFAQAQENVKNAVIASTDNRVVMVIASNECTADLTPAVNSVLVK